MADERQRWDTDEQFTGVADGMSFMPDVSRLVAATTQPGWITEDADAHLGGHLRTAVDVAGSPWSWQDQEQGADGVFTVSLAHSPAKEIDVYRDAVALLATVAEDSFHVRRLDGHTVECVTGMLDGDGDFAPHGHTIRLRIS